MFKQALLYPHRVADPQSLKQLTSVYVRACMYSICFDLRQVKLKIIICAKATPNTKGKKNTTHLYYVWGWSFFVQHQHSLYTYIHVPLSLFLWVLVAIMFRSNWFSYTCLFACTARKFISFDEGAKGITCGMHMFIWSKYSPMNNSLNQNVISLICVHCTRFDERKYNVFFAQAQGEKELKFYSSHGASYFWLGCNNCQILIYIFI